MRKRACTSASIVTLHPRSAAIVNLAYLARQPGHAKPTASCYVCAHLFDEAASGGRAREYVNGQFAVLTTNG